MIRFGQYGFKDFGLIKEVNQSRMELAEAQIVSYMRIELVDCCPVCEAVRGLNITADDTATKDQYELLHYGCRGFWWENYEGELGANIVDWKAPSVDLRKEWMNPLNANITPPSSEIKTGLINWYKENGMSAKGLKYLKPTQLKAQYAEIAALDPQFVKRFEIFKAQIGYVEADMIARSFCERAMEKGLRGVKEIKAYMRNGGLTEYRITKYMASQEFDSSLMFYKEMDNVLGLPKMF